MFIDSGRHMMPEAEPGTGSFDTERESRKADIQVGAKARTWGPCPELDIGSQTLDRRLREMIERE